MQRSDEITKLESEIEAVRLRYRGGGLSKTHAAEMINSLNARIQALQRAKELTPA